MPATDSFTSSSVAVAAPSATLTTSAMMSDGPGVAVEYTRRGFRVAEYQNRVQITKASTFGGSQSALSLPLSLDDARDLAPALLRLTT